MIPSKINGWRLVEVRQQRIGPRFIAVYEKHVNTVTRPGHIAYRVEVEALIGQMGEAVEEALGGLNDN